MMITFLVSYSSPGKVWSLNSIRTSFVSSTRSFLVPGYLELVIDVCNTRKGYDSLTFPWFSLELVTRWIEKSEMSRLQDLQTARNQRQSDRERMTTAKGCCGSSQVFKSDSEFSQHVGKHLKHQLMIFCLSFLCCNNFVLLF